MLTKQQIIENINSKLKLILGENFSEFKSNLKKNACVISGSFIIDCILNTDLSNDIDIYVPYSENMTFYENPTSPFNEYICNNFKFKSCFAANRYSHDLDKGNILTFIRDHVSNGKKLQVINTSCFDSDAITKFILENFDFDICKNYYYINSEEEDELYIHDLKNLIQKTINWDYKGNFFSTLVRTEKYQKREFKIVLPTNFFDIVKKEYGQKIKFVNYDISHLNGIKIIMKNYQNYEDLKNFDEEQIKHFTNLFEQKIPQHAMTQRKSGSSICEKVTLTEEQIKNYSSKNEYVVGELRTVTMYYPDGTCIKEEITEHKTEHCDGSISKCVFKYLRIPHYHIKCCAHCASFNDTITVLENVPPYHLPN